MNEPGTVAVRGYQSSPVRPFWEPEPYRIESTLTFDTETQMTPAQRLRVGCYIYRTKGRNNTGFFYDTKGLTPSEIETLKQYCTDNHYHCQTVIGFQGLLARVARKERTAVVGFNLPFDFSRIATDWREASGKFKDGFTFDIGMKIRVGIKHLSARKSMYRWSSYPGQGGPCKAVIVDVMTLGAAMSGRSHSLESLAKSLQVSHLKGSAEHGKTLTTEYLEYLLRDVQATQDCYDALSTRYASFGLTTPLNAIYSEASLGKAYLRSFGVHPTERLPDDITGKIMSTYYGGRAEVHIRKEIIPVIYTDFLSMYPTVCTKMGIWKYAIAKEIRCYDATERVRKLLAKASHKGPGILRDNGLWGVFPTIVSVVPDNDVLPVRKTYRKGGYNIGVNEVSSSELGQAIWYTLPDCIASCFITGKVPQVIEAIGFEPGETQDNLNTLALMGNEDLQINPYTDDYYKRLIELRKSDTTNADEKQALKILANSTCYGIFVELTRDTVTEPKEHIYYSHDGELHRTRTRYVETPGAYFNPLLATSITGAARMLLAAAERLARDRGVNWALCDTDSMAFCSEETLPGLRTKPVVATASLNVLVDEIVDFFGDLNPYDFGGSILKKEDVNEGGILYAYCVSAKRYALFNDDLQARNMVHDKVCSGIKVRKASAHGLGYLKRPYGKAMTETGAPEWVNDLWVCCIECAGEYEDFCLDSMPMLLAPAQSQVTLNTASLFRQLAGYNAKVSIDERIRPFGFIASYQCNDAKVSALSPMFVSMDDCANTIFDKNTLKEVYREQCKTYRDVLAFFASHPESKFKTDGNGRGILQRRHIEIQDFEVIGKESNRIDPERTQDFAFTVQPMIERKGRIRVRKVED